MGARMEFTGASFEKLEYPHCEKGVKATLTIDAPLSPKLAEALRITHLFKPNGDPDTVVGNFDLQIKLADVIVHVPSPTSDGTFDEFRPDIIWKWKVKVIDEVRRAITFRMNISGDAECDRAYDFRKSQVAGKFDFAITSMQQEFDFSADNPGGSEVDMSGGESDEDEDQPELFACEHCDAGVALTANGEHVIDAGELVPCTHPNQRVDKPGPVLASAREMGARKKKPRDRPAPPTDEEITDAVTVQ